MIRLLLLYCLCAFVAIPAFGQKESNNWYFGNNAAITFNNGAPQLLAGSAMTQREGTATISDAQGNLLFYTDGVTVWDRTNTPMPNGTGLLGDNLSTQSAIVVPLPLSTTKYYVFTISDWQTTSGGLYYSIIDMTLNGGQGDVTTKNVLLNANAREQVTSMYATSNCDTWIMSHQKNTSEFTAYRLSASGTISAPVSSVIGMPYTGGIRYGYLKFSPTGKKIVSALGSQATTVNPTVELFDFDAVTGIVSNPVPLVYGTVGTPLLNAYAAEFSADASKLYVCNAAGDPAIYQFDLSSGVPATMAASITNIASNSRPKTGLQRGPDQKIYVSSEYSTYLGAIQSPDVAGVLCNYVDNVLSLGTGQGRLGFPNFMQSFLVYPQLGQDKYDLCAGQSLALSVTQQPNVTYEWFNSSGSLATGPTYTATTSDTYWIKATFQGCPHYDTTIANFKALPVVNLGPDVPLCDGDTKLLDVTTPTATYVWQDNSTNPTFTVTAAGTYSVTVTANGCSNSDAVDIVYNPLPVVDLGPDKTLCNGTTLTLDATATAATYKWQDNSTNASFAVGTAGHYSVAVTQNGCTASDAIDIAYNPLPVINLGHDINVCQGTPVKLDATTAGATYQWQDGSTAPVYAVTKDGTYDVTVTDANHCQAQDNIDVHFFPYPQVSLGADGQYCKAPLVLDATTTGATTYQWQDNSDNTTFTVQNAGQYWVKATNSIGCSNSDTINITFDNSSLFLGTNTSICPNDHLTLAADTHIDMAATYLWQDGSTDADYEVQRPGRYTVTVTTACTSLSDTIVVSAKDCSCRVYMPNAFSPNNDGRNDTFRPEVLTCGFRMYHLQIFSRWGNPVFESNDPLLGWDGSVKGHPADAAAYVYVLQYQTQADAQWQQQQGTITLVR